MISTDLALFEQSAAAASRLLKAMAHDSRLLVLCQLVDSEMQAGQFATRLSQSALSQHLAVLRTDGWSPPDATARLSSIASPIRR